MLKSTAVGISSDSRESCLWPPVPSSVSINHGGVLSLRLCVWIHRMHEEKKRKMATQPAWEKPSCHNGGVGKTQGAGGAPDRHLTVFSDGISGSDTQTTCQVRCGGT